MPSRKHRQTQDKIEPLVSEESLTELCIRTGIQDIDLIATNILRAYHLLKGVSLEGPLPAEVKSGIAQIIKTTDPKGWKQFLRLTLAASEDISKRAEVKYLLLRAFERVFPYTQDGMRCMAVYCKRVLGPDGEVSFSKATSLSIEKEKKLSDRK